MAKQNTLIHVNSNELNYTGDGAKNPQITDLNYGEIAINYKSGYETIFIKNDTDTIIPFNPVSLTEKDFWNQKDRIFNSDKSINVICSTNGVIIGDSTNIVIGTCSVAEGSGTTASGICSHAEGTGTIANGNHSHAEGNRTTASGLYSHSEGFSTQANGTNSHSEGRNTIANEIHSHSEGLNTIAGGMASHAEGEYTITTNRAEHASGVYNSSISANTQIISALTTSPTATLFSVGNGTAENRRKNAFEIKYNGNIFISNRLSVGLNNTITGAYAVAIGNTITASGDNSHAEGIRSVAIGESSHAEGRYTRAVGNNSHSEGDGAAASGTCSHAEGYQTQTLSSYAHAEGRSTIASGTSSHSEGNSTKAYANYSHAEGDGTIASGNDSHAEGYVTIASGNHSHAEGNRTTASGTCSHAEGSGTTANGAASHTEGAFTIAYNTYEHAGGRYNLSTSGNSSSTGATIFSIGIGTSDSDRKNAIEVTQTGALIANTSWTTGSDRKLKDNITLLEDGVLDKVLKLKPSRFTLKADLEEEKRVQIGFIAQEIEEVFPEYVVIHTDNKGEETRYLDYEKICVVLTKALQEQQEIIDKQNERLSIIEQKLNIL